MTPRIRALLVDRGSPDASRILSLLAEAGYEVFRAFSGESALADLPRMQPGIVILVEPAQADSVTEIAGRIRLTPAGRLVPILLLLGAQDSRRLTDDHWQDAGCDGVLEHPFTDREFAEAVGKALESRGSKHARLSLVSDLSEVDSELESAMQELEELPAGPVAEAASGAEPPRQTLTPTDPSGQLPDWGRTAGAPRTLEDLGWRQRGPTGVVEPPPSRLDPARPGQPPPQPAPADPGLQMRTIITLGAGALLAVAGVAFLVWLLVYTGFDGTEARPPLIERVGDGTGAEPETKQDSFDESDNPGDEADDEEPGGDQLLPNSDSAAPPLVLPPWPDAGPPEEPGAQADDAGPASGESPD